MSGPIVKVDRTGAEQVTDGLWPRAAGLMDCQNRLVAEVGWLACQVSWEVRLHTIGSEVGQMVDEDKRWLRPEHRSTPGGSASSSPPNLGSIPYQGMLAMEAGLQRAGLLPGSPSDSPSYCLLVVPLLPFQKQFYYFPVLSRKSQASLTSVQRGSAMLRQVSRSERTLVWPPRLDAA